MIYIYSVYNVYDLKFLVEIRSVGLYDNYKPIRNDGSLHVVKIHIHVYLPTYPPIFLPHCLTFYYE